MLWAYGGSATRLEKRKRIGIGIVLVAVIAALSYVPIAYVAYQAMGWLFGPSGGHPPVANAPEWVYWLVFVFAVPLICIAIAWLCVWNAQCWIGRR